ncbi:hypothetical protein DZF91_14285 [Actinomadura logoneensis]|uniref:Uncharacterized protein n=1 Tax=Actinomadura logoneensis TaxID=2293572 RepID=A0A372JMC3_9ACTN|nr:hypothetical protein [Actinomadura logoneensis]RFU40986.1 hypothetical protein DZF91_14285 [Actinomadura logoneensis]
MDSDTISLADPAGPPPESAASAAVPTGAQAPSAFTPAFAAAPTSGADGREPGRSVSGSGDTLVYSPHGASTATLTAPPATAPAPAQAPAGPDAEPGHGGASPVFVDLSGRRRRMGRQAGIACGGLLAAFLLAMGIGVATGANVPGTPWKAGSTARSHKSQAPALLPKSIPNGQKRPSGRPPVAVPPGVVPSGPNRTTNGRGPAPTGSGKPSALPKPSSTSSASPRPSVTRTRPGNSPSTPPGHTKRPKTTG